jgi:hypothetical protein
VGLPPPDSPGGYSVLWAIILGLVYILLMIGAYSAFCAEGFWVVTLNLVLGAIVSFFLIASLASERSRATSFELEFARTVEAHQAAGETLAEASPLGGILASYAHAAEDQRRAAREHSYAAGPAVYSTAIALGATLLLGLSYATGSDPNLIGVAMLVELPAFVLLGLSTGILALSVGRSADVKEFDAIVLRRWVQVTKPSFAFTHALSSVPWAAENPPERGPAAWSESATPDAGSV